MTEWQDTLVGARMAVDREFADRVAGSRFSRQQWGLIMTAVEFDVAEPSDPDRATMVADTDKLRHVVPELESVEREVAAVAGAGGAGGAGAGGSGGVLGSLRDLLGLGDAGPDHDELERAAAALAEEYAAELQAHLEAQGRWEEIRQAASG